MVGLRQQHKLSERQACKILSLRRSVYRYKPRPNRDQEVVKVLLELAQWATGTRVRQVVPAAQTVRPQVESQTCLSHLLQPETEQTAQRQKAFAYKDTGPVTSEHRDE
jgi:hypothetical protein